MALMKLIVSIGYVCCNMHYFLNFFFIQIKYILFFFFILAFILHNWDVITFYSYIKIWNGRGKKKIIQYKIMRTVNNKYLHFTIIKTFIIFSVSFYLIFFWNKRKISVGTESLLVILLYTYVYHIFVHFILCFIMAKVCPSNEKRVKINHQKKKKNFIWRWSKEILRFLIMIRIARRISLFISSWMFFFWFFFWKIYQIIMENSNRVRVFYTHVRFFVPNRV